MGVLDASYPLPRLAFLLSFLFLLPHFNHSGGCAVESHVVLIWSSLMTNSIAYLSLCLLFTGTISFVKLSVDLFKQTNKQQQQQTVTLAWPRY